MMMMASSRPFVRVAFLAGGISAAMLITGCADKDDSVVDHVPVPIPNDEFDTAAYLGLWQQAYASEGVAAWNARCVTGEYGIVAGNENAITVRNKSCIPGVIPCKRYALDGFASRSAEEDASKTSFYVKNGATEVPTYSPIRENYRIFELGPLNENGKYSWALVSNGRDGTKMYILVRDIESFKGSEDEEDAMEVARDNGFHFEGEETETRLKPLIETSWKDCEEISDVRN